MTNRRYRGLVLAASLALAAGTAAAAPADCLSLRDNAQVAACANQYGSGAPAARARPAADPKSAQLRAARPVESLELIALPVVRRGVAAPAAPQEEHPTFDVDRSALTNTMVAGAAGASLLVLVALVLWRMGAKLRRACRWCGSRIARSAHACPSCFRAV